MTAYSVLFLTALIAATLVPAQSESVLSGLLLTHHYSTAGLVVVASVGNILGSMINYALGRGIERFKNRKWFPASDKQLQRASRWYERYGRWSLLLSWAPFIGDPLTVIAGVLKEKFWIFTAIVSCAKIARYLFVAAVILKWTET